MATIISYSDKCPRQPLAEGTTSGVAFAFCKPTPKDGGLHLETVQPLSPCKDYLNDVVYSERTGKPYQAWGLHTKKNDIFLDGRAYLAISALATKNVVPPEDEVAALINGISHIQSRINELEEKLKIYPTAITKMAPNVVVAEIDEWWTQYTYLISLWSWLFRVLVADDPKDGRTLDQALVHCKTKDSYYRSNITPKIAFLLKNPAPHQDLTIITNPHDRGIYSHPFPKA